MYKNRTKDEARSLIWNHTIATLTSKKNYSTIVTEKDINLYWEHVKHFLKEHKILDLSSQEDVCQQFIDFRNANVKLIDVKNIKVLFFCGPEPENDIEILMNLGILEENIWAVELDKSNYNSALNVLKHAYPNVKIFKTKIEHLFEVIKVKFDVIYLDFTAPFFSREQKPFKTTIELFKNNVLNDFGVLITNYSELNPSDKHFDEDITTIKEYFNYQTFVHELTEERGTYIESPHANEDNFLDIVKDKYSDSYSSFLTHFHLYLAEVITPSFNIFKNDSIKAILFNEKLLKIHLKKINELEFTDEEDFILFGDKITDPEDFWFEYFFENIEKLNPQLYGYLKANKVNNYIALTNLLKNLYSDREFLNSGTREYLEETQSNLIDPKGGIFCDVPMLHLWVHLLVNQLGSPYHVNLKNHKRFRYIGKTREMFVDIFTIDKCRYFYDWIPSISTLPENMLNVAKQLLLRINIDIIRKNHQFYLLDESFKYGNLVCYNDDGVTFSKELYLEKRKTLKPRREDENLANKFEEMFELADSLAKKVSENYCASFSSFKRINMTYTAHGFVTLKIKTIPEEFKIFGRQFNKHKIGEQYNFEYLTHSKEIYYRSDCRLNGSYTFDMMIAKTIASVFKRYGLICEINGRLN